jgi:hypothetical protein
MFQMRFYIEIQRPFTQFQHRAYDKQVDADNTLLRRAMAGKHPPAEEKPGKHYCGNMKNVGLTGWINNGNALRE